MCISRKIVAHVKGHSVVVKLLSRKRSAFAILHPQVEVTKSSPTVQVATAATLAAAILTGRFSRAAGLAAAWLGSRPLTYIVAGGVACIGEIDAAIIAAAARCRRMQGEPKEG